MPVTMWLKTVRQEVRRQAAILGVEWRERQLYHEVASHLAGEAQRWFATVMESVPPEQETIGTLSDMLRAKYMAHHTTPEVVDLLNARRQMRGEKLVEYAQILREIGERGDIGEDWLVNAFLKGMSSSDGATHVRGHRPQTLVEAVNLAVPHVGEYGEGYGVGLDVAMGRWDEREAAHGRGPLAAPTAAGGTEQLAAADNFGNVVSGYGAAWGSAEQAPRYDTSGRPVTDGRTGSTEWWRAIPPGFQLTPKNSHSAASNTKPQPTTGSKRALGCEQTARTKAKTLKVEGQRATSTYGPRQEESAFATREGRLQRNQQRLQQMAPRATFVPRAGSRCYYCNHEGHFARDCKRDGGSEHDHPGYSAGHPARRQRSAGECIASVSDPNLRLAIPERDKETRGPRSKRRARKKLRSRRLGVLKTGDGGATRGKGGSDTTRQRHERGRAELDAVNHEPAPQGSERHADDHEVERDAVTPGDREQRQTPQASTDPCTPGTTSHTPRPEPEPGPGREETCGEVVLSADAATERRPGSRESGGGSFGTVKSATSRTPTIENRLTTRGAAACDPGDDDKGRDYAGSPTSIQAAIAAELGRRDKTSAAIMRVTMRQLAANQDEQLEVELRARKRQKRLDKVRARRERQERYGEAPASVATSVGRTTLQLVESRPPLLVRTIGTCPVSCNDITRRTILEESRARRRHEKRIRKARAKERREIQARLAEMQFPEEAYFAYDDLCRQQEAARARRPSPRSRRGSKHYSYRSNSVYVRPRVRYEDGDTRPMRVGGVRAVQAEATDTLPTARAMICGEQKQVKLDTGAQYSVAGEAWQAYGERQDVLPPVDYVEGFTGAVARVLGVWRFRFRTQYEQIMEVDALIIEGATTEFLVGEDWMLRQGTSSPER
ncbi:hypothetical protein DVH05_002709 [Phytophthora capsici]|nr:hypothetical protein DVH05_002709 [Phytophthora capsici]